MYISWVAGDWVSYCRNKKCRAGLFPYSILHTLIHSQFAIFPQNAYNVAVKQYLPLFPSRKFVRVVCFAALASGCRPFGVMTIDPSGPPEYVLGWEDGCDSGLSAEGGLEYKIMYGFKKRPEMAANDQYKQGWNEGFTYCRFSLAAGKPAGLPMNLGWGEGF